MLPFWLFVLFFKFGAGLHYALLSTLGSRVLPVWVVGLCVGGAALLQLILDIPTGALLDRVGYVRLLRLGTFVFLVGTAALFFGLTPATFLLTLLLSEFGWLIFGPGTNAYVLSKAPKHVSGKFLGFFHAVMALGIVLASAAFAVVADKGVFVIAGALTAILAVALFFAFVTRSEPTAVREETNAPRHAHVVRRRFLYRLFASLRALNPASSLLAMQSFAGALFYGSIWFTVPLILATNERGGLLSVSLGIFDLAVVLLGSFLGRLADRYDQKRLVLLGLLLFAGAGSLIGFHLDVWFLLLGFLATAGDEMSHVSLWAWLDRLDAKHDEDGLVSAAIVLFEDLGWTIGPALAGLLFVAIGPAWTIALCSAPIFLTWIASVVFFSERHEPASSRPAVRHESPRRLRHKG